MRPEIILNEVQFKAVRSSGAGGQHVNKTSSKVELSFSILTSEGLTASEKELLGQRLSNRLTTAGVLLLQNSDSRSQHRNKKLVIDQLLKLLKENLKVDKPRLATKPSKGAIERRLQSKKLQAKKKANRKPPPTS